MTTTLSIAELDGADGQELGSGPWHVIEQERIDLFADATDDHQWIHVDPEAAAAGPFGATVAHGYLTLALLPGLLAELLTLSDCTLGVNYGIDRIRFPAPVRVGSRIRLHATIRSTERRGDAVAYTVGVSVEIEGEEKPALAGDVVYLAR
ncbi:MAG TPA: MaoC family dehydratase [Gaiellaceae bacterium]